MDTTVAAPQVTFRHAGASVTIAEETIRRLWLDSAAAGQAAPPLLLAPRIGEKDGEGHTYMGVVRNEDNVEYRVWDMGEAPNTMTHQAALAWAKERGGDLPTRREQSLMFANRSTGQFREAWYWSNETHAGDEGFAWVQAFGAGDQGDGRKSLGCRARAVRREPIQ